jgi:hypothetical protein
MDKVQKDSDSELVSFLVICTDIRPGGIKKNDECITDGSDDIQTRLFPKERNLIYLDRSEYLEIGTPDSKMNRLIGFLSELIACRYVRNPIFMGCVINGGGYGEAGQNSLKSTS